MEDPLVQFAATVFRKSASLLAKSSALISPSFIALAVCQARAMRGSPTIDPLSNELPLFQANLLKPSTTGPSKSSTPVLPTLFSLFDDPSERTHDSDDDEMGDSDDEMRDMEDEDMFDSPLSDSHEEFAIPSAEANTVVRSTPDMTVDEAVGDWDNGEEIMPDERVFLLALGSDLERARMMNMRRRDRESLDDGLISQIPSMIPKSSVAAKEAGVAANKAAKGKGTSAKKNKSSSASGLVAAAKKKSSPSVSADAKKKKAASSALAAAKKKAALSVSAAAKKKAPSISRPARAKKTPSKPQLDSPNDPPIVPLVTLTIAEPILSSAPPVLSAVSFADVEEDAVPEWMEELMPNLTTMCEGPRWTSLLVKWTDLERQLRFPKGRVSNL